MCIRNIFQLMDNYNLCISSNNLIIGTKIYVTYRTYLHATTLRLRNVLVSTLRKIVIGTFFALCLNFHTFPTIKYFTCWLGSWSIRFRIFSVLSQGHEVDIVVYEEAFESRKSRFCNCPECRVRIYWKPCFTL